MALAYVNGISAAAVGTGTSLAATYLNIAAGDILVAWACWEDGDAGTVTVGDGGDNSLTGQTASNYGGNYGQFFVKSGCAANASATITFANSTSRPYRIIYVYQFRPDTGETVSIAAGPSASSGTGTSLSSGQISPTGSDLMVIGACKIYKGQTWWSGRLIAGADPDAFNVVGNLTSVWYKAFAESQSNITAAITGSVSAAWICDILAIKSETPGGASPVPKIIAAYMRGR